MKPLVLLSLLLATNIAPAQPPSSPVVHLVVHLVHGLWFNGSGFQKNDFYVADGLLTHRPSKRRSYQTVDLHPASSSRPTATPTSTTSMAPAASLPSPPSTCTTASSTPRA